MSRRRDLLRTRTGREDNRVTFVELFFDLVFVFAVTQLTHSLLNHLTFLGLLQTALLLMAVWWVWMYTAWVTNWLDPERGAVRLMLFVLMLAGLILSTSVPKAFETRGLEFAAAFVFMQVGRCVFMLWTLRGVSPGAFRNFQRITSWLLLAALFWIAGGLADANTRLGLWAVALAAESLSPSFGFWVPGLGRSTTADWNIDGGHMAERCGLFIIIALGESILVTGAVFASSVWTAEVVAAFVVAFIGSVAMWSIYFTIAERATHLISSASDTGRLAAAYNYIHLPLVAGIIVAAAADELVLAHPAGSVNLKTAAVVLGGPVFYLAGNFFFKRVTADRLPFSQLVGIALLMLLIPACDFLTPLALSAATTAILVAVAGWERFSLRTAIARGAEL